MGFMGTSLFNPQAGLGMPPTGASPSVPPDPTLDRSLLEASEQGRQLVAEQIARARSQADTMQQLREQQAALPLPATGYRPHFQPPDSVGHLLGDVGKGLLLGLTATRPGRAVESSIYGPGQREYAMRSGSLARQIEEVQEQQKTEQQPVAAAAGMVYHPYMAGARMLGAEASMKRADTAAQAVANTKEFRDALLQLDTARLSESERHNRQDEALRGMGVEVQRERNSVMLSLGDKRITIDAGKFDAGVNNRSQGFLDQIGQALGLKEFKGVGGETAPVESVAPTLGGGTKKPAARGSGKVVRWGRDSAGNPVRLP